MSEASVISCCLGTRHVKDANANELTVFTTPYLNGFLCPGGKKMFYAHRRVRYVSINRGFILFPDWPQDTFP